MCTVPKGSLLTNRLAVHRSPLFVFQFAAHQRPQSSLARLTGSGTDAVPPTTTPSQQISKNSPLKRLPTWHLIRNIVLSTFLTRPILFKPGFAVIQRIANSQSFLLNPDRNVVIKAILKPVLYHHFCAGTNAKEIDDTIATIKKQGFSGVALVFNGETVVAGDQQSAASESAQKAEITAWRDSTLLSLDKIDDGNFLGMKFTGAGKCVTDAMVAGAEPPAAFLAAMDDICQKARNKGCRIWVDAEQQAVQRSIDKWVVPLMRKYNRGEKALIYNTIQAYLKESRAKLAYQLGLAQEEGWVMGLKLVRGAYMSIDPREKIHDTKAETDACYDGIVRDLLSGSLQGFSKENFPQLQLFLAGHNSETVRKALTLAQQLAQSGQLKVSPEFGQLQGMADDVGGEIIQFGEDVLANRTSQPGKVDPRSAFVPKVYKCLHWGTIQESMQYLVRRAVENSAAVDRMKETAIASRRELFGRMQSRIWGN